MVDVLDAEVRLATERTVNVVQERRAIDLGQRQDEIVGLKKSITSQHGLLNEPRVERRTHGAAHQRRRVVL
jgi:hypothetical protein